MDTADEEHWLQKDNDKLDFRVALSYDDYWGTFDDDDTSEDTNTTSKDGDDFNSSVQFTLVEPEWLNKVFFAMIQLTVLIMSASFFGLMGSYFVTICMAFCFSDVSAPVNVRRVQVVLTISVYAVTLSILGIFLSVCLQFWLWFCISVASVVPDDAAREGINIAGIIVIPMMMMIIWGFRCVKICRLGVHRFESDIDDLESNTPLDYSNLYIDDEKDDGGGKGGDVDIDTGGVCSICLDDLSVPPDGLDGGLEGGGVGFSGTLKCGHRFHKYCVERWFDEGVRGACLCPECRQDAGAGRRGGGGGEGGGEGETADEGGGEEGEGQGGEGEEEEGTGGEEGANDRRRGRQGWRRFLRRGWRRSFQRTEGEDPDLDSDLEDGGDNVEMGTAGGGEELTLYAVNVDGSVRAVRAVSSIPM
ncbi:hypothetical protein TrCOL_g9558 [Triparma columacea]|uniref:RING-type domain-containing protein n=1 Tax=Triparma columacea TaxID=722753 RepID=A0A9W7GIE7_9STRA|nr:hypothetical protein TrCOL_g9558 [Triparma columacea]